MANLADDPKEWELEDLVAAHFMSRGCFVECGITERDPDAIGELDVVWTDYRLDPPTRHPVEVKSGEWGLTDIFKFYGWTNYLKLPPGQFAHRVAPKKAKDGPLAEKVSSKTGIRMLHVAADPTDVAKQFASLGLPAPAAAYLPTVWRFSYWARRRLFHALQQAIQQNVCPETAKKAKEYRHLVNDALFFEADPRDRFEKLVEAHFSHRKLALTAAAETAGLGLDFDNPPQSDAFKQALYQGRHFPVQACMYLQHRGKLHVLKAAVDYWKEKQAGVLKKIPIKFGDLEVDLGDAVLTKNFGAAVDEFSNFGWFPLLPVFWQVFLWGWGGFLLSDRLDSEYAALAAQTGIPIDAVPKVGLPEFRGRLHTVEGRSSRCRSHVPRTRRSCGDGWWSWCDRGAAPNR